MIKIAINGFGRIGRPVLRRILDKHPDLKVVAINDLTDQETLRHLFKYDSSYGIYEKEIPQDVNFFAEKDPEKLPWGKLEVDVVLECTGIFTDYDSASKHIKAGAKRVIMSAPSKDADKIPTYLLGVNTEKFDPKKDPIIDMGSCTTNCLAPIAKILNESFGIVKGFMTTIHSYTNDQRILDLPHKDLRRARAAALSIIPTSTGAAKAIGRALPELEGKLDGIALRVPTAVVSTLDLVCQVEKKVSVEEVNAVFKKAEKEDKWRGIFITEKAPLVSADFRENSHSSIVDLPLTMAKDDMVKVIGWYDNEWGYACRLAEMAEFVGKK
ncbi:MAG: type I glyceraldehyde-3-phosphate dehydrogenase [Candidatus Pacebacteria bacterium]|nr:type I glyceraldehyde-3-phosphate dehydrogenase [Candidatus Paceibacterota bacterium]